MIGRKSNKIRYFKPFLPTTNELKILFYLVKSLNYESD